MNHSPFNLESPEEPSLNEDVEPEFGLVDIVEAFTAMRHEWRGQTIESRAAAESVQAASAALQELEAKLLAHAAESSTDESKKLAEVVVDVDHQLARSIAAAEQAETNRRLRDEAAANAVVKYFEGMNPLARWFARPLLAFATEQSQSRNQTGADSSIEGLNLILARLRRMLKEHQIERIETLGQAFDATTMNAIGTVDSTDYPAGHVAEQLSPCYRWHGRVLRFADVRVTSTQAVGVLTPIKEG